MWGVDARSPDPVAFQRRIWPHVKFYREQVEVIYSVERNDETFVPAGNMLGKDYVAGYVALSYFLRHKTVRVITTSVKDDHLRVLWGEIGRFIQEAKEKGGVDLVYSRDNPGGILVYNHRDIRKMVGGRECKISYLRGMVSEKGEGMAGHHAPHTLGIIDEASGVDDQTYTQMGTWAKRILAIGNCNDCPRDHWFRKGVRDGDVPDRTYQGAAR